MKPVIPGLVLASGASAAHAANWGEFAWGAGLWGSNAIAVPVDSPLLLLGVAASLAGAALWYLGKPR